MRFPRAPDEASLRGREGATRGRGARRSPAHRRLRRWPAALPVLPRLPSGADGFPPKDAEPRETDVLARLAQGESNAEIAVVPGLGDRG
ncbi:hypothetical protein ACQ86D_44215 [Streptomyces galilaeus]